MNKKKGKIRSVGVNLVPLCVFQGPVDMIPVTGVINQHHACNGQPAEYIQ